MDSCKRLKSTCWVQLQSSYKAERHETFTFVGFLDLQECRSC